MKIEQAGKESYRRAVTGQSDVNDLTVIAEFAARGIAATPRVDVFTYNAWKYERKRQVRKGEKSVKLVSFFEDENTGKKRFTRAAVFHISQTDPIN